MTNIKIFLIFLIFILLVFLLVIGLGLYRTWKVQNSPNQLLFLKGSIPSPLPDGPFKGSVSGYNGSWQGKKFHKEKQTGINLLKENGKLKEKFPFKTYVGKGIADKETNVLKIDYNISLNPLWLRFILDEVVEIKPNKYLGKVHLTIIPGLPFTLGYFNLEQ